MEGADAWAFSFDADQTLWDFRTVMRTALAAALTELERRRPDVRPGTVTAADLTSARDALAQTVAGRSHDLEEVRRESFALVLRHHHLYSCDLVDDLTRVYFDVRYTKIRLYPDAEPTLRSLHQRGHRLGLLTNGNTDPARCGLPGVFDSVIFGPVEGTRKPDPSLFRKTASSLGVRPDHLVHVGDGWDDVAGANSIGAISVLLCRSRRDVSAASEASFVITRLSELEDLLPTILPTSSRDG